jgi:hypothetical protein
MGIAAWLSIFMFQLNLQIKKYSNLTLDLVTLAYRLIPSDLKLKTYKKPLS